MVRIGVDLGGTKILLLAISSEERVVEKIPTGPNFTVADAESAIRGFVARYQTAATAVGIAVPGLVDEDGRVVASDVLPQIEGWVPASSLKLPMKTSVLNDAEAALAQELTTLSDCSTAGLVLAGTGIGAAFLVEGRVLRGARRWAGELGSIPLSVDEKYMTLDAMASGAAILKRLDEPIEIVSAKAQRGDPQVLQVFSQCGAALGAGLASVINLLNPSLLVIAGGTLRWPGYASAAMESARALSIPQLWESCSVRESSFGEQLVALGAARAVDDLEKSYR